MIQERVAKSNNKQEMKLSRSHSKDTGLSIKMLQVKMLDHLLKQNKLLPYDSRSAVLARSDEDNTGSLKLAEQYYQILNNPDDFAKGYKSMNINSKEPKSDSKNSQKR